MGLAGAKKRTKIGHDPNNTNWTLSTSRYGHRLLTSAGWTPGATLGAKNAAHSVHYTAGSEGHIRIRPCVEGKGLGAKNTTDDTFGLRVLSGLLGRLNGRDTTLIEEQLERRRGEGYVEQRGWGVHFVFGGYLVGDKIEKEKNALLSQAIEESTKKRKDVSTDEDHQTRSMPRADVVVSTKKAKKIKRHKSDKDSQVPVSTVVTKSDNTATESSAARLERKAAKAQRRELRRLRKEKTMLQGAEAASMSPLPEVDRTQPEPEDLDSSVKASPVSSALASGVSTPFFTGARGRHAMRHKHIDQKRMACMDEKALNEIFMIKSNG